ncbi:RRNA processing protein Pwp1 [Penicillium sp. DV-2018c]|nr:RRNA processing protein Pwp1 [Penicillium sp. DV-2018c]
MSSMITTTTWVKRGVAAQFPTKYVIDEAEMGRISKLARMQLEEAKDDMTAAQAGEDDGDNAMEEDTEEKPSAKAEDTTHADDDDVLKEFDMDNYDKEEVDEHGERATMFGNVQSLAYHAPNEEDPYLVIPEDEDDEEREELQIMPHDNLLLAGKVEDEVAHLEVYVYEDKADNLYVHHDIMLPGIPLCTEWLDIPVGQNTEGRTQGNFVAIGTMEPDIEIWDLDIVDCMYPNAILGQGGQDEKTKKKQKKKVKANDEYHIDAVLALAANRQHRNLLASGSADKTVKLWDLTTTTCAKSYSNHKDKVCSLDWHPTESTILLSGSYDRTVVAADMRAPDAQARWGVDTDVECVRWDMHDPNFFYVTTDGGMVYRYDMRNVPSTPAESKPVWSLQAHDASVSSFDINRSVPGFLVTGSTDKQVKLWNVENDKPNLVVTRKLEVGKVFSTSFAPDQEVSFRLAVAGSKGNVQIWDASTNAAVRRAFVSRLPDLDGDVEERLVGINADDDEESDDEGEDGGEDDEPRGGDGWESMDED